MTLQQEVAAGDAWAPLIHPNLAEVYRQRVERLHEALNDPSTRDEAFELIRSLIEEIRLVPEDSRLHRIARRTGRHPGTFRRRQKAWWPFSCRAGGANQDGCGGRI